MRRDGRSLNVFRERVSLSAVTQYNVKAAGHVAKLRRDLSVWAAHTTTKIQNFIKQFG
jgi:hypothetical protein